jgi:hypothetical protein
MNIKPAIPGAEMVPWVKTGLKKRFSEGLRNCWYKTTGG